MCRRRIIGVLAVILVLVSVLVCGCGGKQNREPVTLTIWHVYGGQTDSPLNKLIQEFNDTVGMEKGIKVEVTVVSNTNNIHDAVLRSANGEPGASELPDMFVSYPKTVLAMPDQEVLVDYHDYMTQDELKDYIPVFIEEGQIGGRLVVFPIAKSTEIMFINKTLFDRFAQDTGASLEQLNTWEGLYALSEEYYQWTDAKTPDVEGDGKNFFVHDYHFNYFQVGVESLGGEFFDGQQICFSPEFETAWYPYARAAVKGGVWLQNGYATEPLRTGDAIVSVASSASVLYYEDIVTYSNNYSEPIEVIARPAPCFRNGEALIMQRGAGLCTVKSTPDREQAATEFVRWLTEPDNNVRFVTSVGYMPVTEEGFGSLPKAVEQLDSPKYKSLYEAFMETQKRYEFVMAPQFDAYLNLEQSFESEVRSKLRGARAAWSGEEASLEELLDQTLLDLKKEF